MQTNPPQNPMYVQSRGRKTNNKILQKEVIACIMQFSVFPQYFLPYQRTIRLGNQCSSEATFPQHSRYKNTCINVA